jgi:peptidoglycan/xylan/chitin deacetylase (PgdA/CDA1 family)
MNNHLHTKTGVLLRWSAAVIAATLAVATGNVAAQAVVPGPATVVSLSFDDGNADQNSAVSILNAAGLKGTFYITTGFIGGAGYLTRADLTSIAAAGHEIGGHTITHPDLTTISATEATNQVCQGRATLASWGFNAVTSFAYPFASVTPAVETIVKNCGFNSARGLGDIRTRFGCPACGFAETIPPADPYYIKAPDEVDSTWTLADLQATVTNAESNGGGWVELTFHHVCDGVCDPTNGLSVAPGVLQQFSDWLAARNLTNNTVVKTVGEVVGGAVAPIVGGTAPAAPGPGVNGVINPSLETAGAGGLPQCWAKGGFGTNTATFSTVTTARTGTAAEQLIVSGLSSGDAKLVLTQDLGTCAPTVTPGHTYSLRAWYQSNVTTQFDVYLRDSNGLWAYSTSSPFFAASAIYTQATFTTAAIPVGTTGISFGLNLVQNGQLTTDDYALYDTVGAPPILGDLVTAVPTITGTPKVGQVLTAVPGAWGPGTVAFTYQWLRAGVAIPGATGATYKPGDSDIGATLTVSVTGTETGFTTATKTSLATAIVVQGDPFFADVTPSAQFYSYIQWMWSAGISTGSAQPTGKPLYRPSGSVSREAMAAFLLRLSGESFTAPSTATFADVNSSSQFYTAIEWMAAKGIAFGTAQPTGKPLYKAGEAVSRSAMALFLARYRQAAVSTPPTALSFADVPLNAPYAAAVKWMKDTGISTGTIQPSGLPLYKPSDPVTRSAMAAFLYRMAHLAP